MLFFGCLSLTLLFLTVAIGLLYVYLSSVNKHWEKLGVPYIKPELFFGNARRLFFLKECIPTALDRLYKELEGHPFGGFYMMMIPCVIIRDPELVNRILVGDFTHFHDRINFPQFKYDPMTNHLFVMGGNLWKEMRLRLSTLFSVSHTRRTFFLIQECCTRLQNNVHNAMKNKRSREFELKDLLSSFTTDVIGMCAFGIECGAIDDVNSQFRRIGGMIFDTTKMGAFRKIVVQMLPRISMLFGLRFFSSSVEQFFVRILVETIEYRKKNGILRDDLIHLLMTLKQDGLLLEETGEKIEFTDHMFAAHLALAFMLGFEMTSTAMSFCLHELSLNPDVQNKVRMEVDAVLSRHGGEMTYEAIQEMKYLDMVVAETLRLYPSMGYDIRQCTEQYEIPDSGVVLQPGTIVYVPLLSLHRDPHYFPDPLRFNPDRFRSASNSEFKDIPAAYLPFGAGPRICLGQKFALTEVKAGVAALLSRFEFRRCTRSSESPVPLEPRKIILAPACGLWVRVTPRAWLPMN